MSVGMVKREIVWDVYIHPLTAPSAGDAASAVESTSLICPISPLRDRRRNMET